jgi:hypothetical protein
MHMLRDEDNQKFKSLILETLEYDPQILKRYVNFMNNPDEDTAISQFGTDGKYFGVCTLMATLPGLPMIGHGQIEGFTEKYGMEYKQARLDENPDEALISRHERLIFPLFKQRRLFAKAENFLLYDFYTSRRKINEDVFAYSNRVDDMHVLVIYHNKSTKTRGRIKKSSAYLEPAEDGGWVLVGKSLAEGLGIPKDANAFLIFRDHVSGLEYIHSCRELHKKGLYVELEAYQAYVFLDFRVVHDGLEKTYTRLASNLGVQGVPRIEIVGEK